MTGPTPAPNDLSQPSVSKGSVGTEVGQGLAQLLVTAVEVADYRIGGNDRSPPSERIMQKRPWDDRCCGPMFIMTRVLPA